ncbi:MAG: alpha/beta fold hydrolase [Ramlibacter sp.]|uniref:alpha/beta fold hydrolase n=1 Tax=Ramlibacter sp. TaxID=1917967 RepID=UPI002619F53C|nr:alpha/beta fold hydrolase [Ramlibacter sp.]MDH4377331.1 alpha/beta fold hydrolase [Ramlibacter sp.]
MTAATDTRSQAVGTAQISAPALALVPGLNNTAAVFDGVLAALPTTVQVHTRDNPPLESVEVIAAHWLERLPQRFWLAGFSFGGYVALAMLEAAPERVAGFALLCSAPQADSAEAAQRRLASLEAVAQGRYFELMEQSAPLAFHPDSLANAALLDRRRKMVQAYGPDHFAAHVRATVARPDRSRLLDGSRPTLVLAASHDKLFTPAQMSALAAGIPGARFVAIEGGGHLVPMEQPRAVAQALSDWVLG